MNSSSLPRVLVFSILAAFTLAVAGPGCATRGYERAAATSDAISAAASQVERARMQITEVTNALRDLSNQPARELPPAFERYRTAVTHLENTAEELRQQTDRMEKEGRTYFDTWDTRLGQIRNEDIRARSAQRQQEVTDQFSEIQRRYREAQRELQPLLSNLRDIRAALGVDLTTAGIETAREFLGRSEESARAARQALDQLADSLRSLSTGLDPTSAPAPITTS